MPPKSKPRARSRSLPPVPEAPHGPATDGGASKREAPKPPLSAHAGQPPAKSEPVKSTVPAKTPSSSWRKPLILIVSSASFIFFASAAAEWIRLVDERNGLPGGLVSIAVASLPLFSPLFIIKELLVPAALEGKLATVLIRQLCPRPDVFVAKPHTVPDYSDEDAWAALPQRRDTADELPPHCGSSACENENQQNSEADLFFVGPTTHYSPTEWTADWNSSSIRYLICEAIIPQQAMPFNHVAKVYSPLIRQMTGFAYFAPETSERERRLAAEIAYSDVRSAFRHYLENWNRGRPIILAGHSQGAEYMLRLLRDEFASSPELKSRLLVAYIVGMPVFERLLREWDIPVCNGPKAVGCVVAWMTFKKGADPFDFVFEPSDPALRSVDPKEPRVCVNPLSWAKNGGYVGPEASKGGMHIVQLTQNFMFLTGSPNDLPNDSHVQLQMNRVRDGLLPLRPNVVGAACNEVGGLEVDPPSFGETQSHFAYRFFPVWRFAAFPAGGLHPMDMNFFWMDIRLNARERFDAWLLSSKKRLSSASHVARRRRE